MHLDHRLFCASVVELPLILLGALWRASVSFCCSIQMINAKWSIHIQDFEMSAFSHLHKLTLVLVKTYKMRIHR